MLRIFIALVLAATLAGCYHPVTFNRLDSGATWHMPRATNLDAASVPAYK